MFCEHANPAVAKFCNECGSPLHLKPCIRCSAINDASAAHCHACGMAFQVPFVTTDSVTGAVPRNAGARRLMNVVTLKGATPSRRLVVTAGVLLAGIAAAVGLFNPATRLESSGQTTVIESVSVPGDAAMRAASTPAVNAADGSGANSTEIPATGAQPSNAPSNEMTQRDTTTAEPDATTESVASSTPAVKAAPATSAVTSKRAAAKSKSTNRAGGSRKPSRAKEPSTR